MKWALQNWHALVASQLPRLLIASMYVPSMPVPVGRVVLLNVAAALLTLVLLMVAARDHRAIQARAAQVTVFVLLALGYRSLPLSAGFRASRASTRSRRWRTRS
jgi:hypothetical protein